MKYAVLSDAHGNKLYFDQCIKKIKTLSVQKLIYLGDIFGYMPDGIHVLNSLRNRGAYILKGNHEAMLLGELDLDLEKDKIYGLSKQKKLIDPNSLSFLSGLNDHLIIETANGKILFVHGAPFDALNGYLYEDNKIYSWNGEIYSFIFMGHTHRPYIKKSGQTTFVNVGSCGLPRDKGLRPSFCVFDDEKMEAEIIRVSISPEILESEYYSKISSTVMNVLRRN